VSIVRRSLRSSARRGEHLNRGIEALRYALGSRFDSADFLADLPSQTSDRKIESVRFRANKDPPEENWAGVEGASKIQPFKQPVSVPKTPWRLPLRNPIL